MSEKRMKVFNLTDVPTKTLEQYNLVDKWIAVGRALVAPGDSVETQDDGMTRSAMAHFLSVGALSVDNLPPGYVLAKEKVLSERRAAEEKKKPEKTEKLLVTTEKKKDK